MPANQHPRRALPARFRRQRVLIVGCGDVGQRAARQLAPLVVRALTSSADKCAPLRALGIMPLVGNLDDAASLRRLAGLAPRVLHLAPPGTVADADLRTRTLLRALARGLRAPRVVYGSTSGVYGDCQGEVVRETRPLRAQTARALRRVDAERQLRRYALNHRRSGARSHVLRIPGIYAGDREGGTPEARLRRGTPVLRAQDDVFTSHIHADDLARAAVSALWRGRPQRITNVCDQTRMRMGDYFDLAADLWGLARPPRISRAEAQQALPATLLSFMSESRRLDNRRMLRELRVALRYPTVEQGLRAAVALQKAKG
ncbi:NAD-binding protein [Comamonas humi]